MSSPRSCFHFAAKAGKIAFSSDSARHEKRDEQQDHYPARAILRCTSPHKESAASLAPSGFHLWITFGF
jgi:hypothetical protein